MSTPSSSPFPGWRRHRNRDEHEGVTDLGRLLLGLTIVTLGVVLLLGSAGVIDSGRAIDRWWPLVIVAAGLFTLVERPPAIVRGLLLTAAGCVLLLFTTDTLDESAWDYIWPAAIVAAGIAVLARWRGRAVPHAGVDDDVVRATAVFGGPHLVSTSPRFRGGWLTAFFGGVTLDLRQAQLAPDGASINATAAFGGIEILVPKGWRIVLRSTPIFGGTEDKTDRTAVPPDDAPTLRIDAVTVFGGLAVEHEKK